MKSNQDRAAEWIDTYVEPAPRQAVFDNLTALFDAVDAAATKRSADMVRTLIADLHPEMDPGLAAVVRKALGHAAKKIEQAGETTQAPKVLG